MKTNRDIESLNKELSLVGKLAGQIAQLALVSYEDVSVELEQRYFSPVMCDYFRVLVYLSKPLAASTYRLLSEQILSVCAEIKYGRIEINAEAQTDYIMNIRNARKEDEYINWKEA